MARLGGFFGAAVATGLAACVMSSSPDSSPELVGTAQIAIVAAPPNVQCIIVTVTGPANVTIQRSIGVKAGQSTLEMLSGLPLGSDVFAGAAYSATCSGVTPNTAANFVSAPVTTTVVSGTPANVTLKMQAAGSANVAVDFPCPTGTANCDGNPAHGCNVNLNTDKNDCGACGNICASVNGTATCSGGMCSITCNSGFANCDGNPAHGCNVNLNTDPAHCSSCSNACSSVNGTATCSGGMCSITCNSGFANCDGTSATNGCNVNLNTDPAHCGSCSFSCVGAQTCVSGGCQ